MNYRTYVLEKAIAIHQLVSNALEIEAAPLDECRIAEAIRAYGMVVGLNQNLDFALQEPSDNDELTITTADLHRYTHYAVRLAFAWGLVCDTGMEDIGNADQAKPTLLH